MAQCQRRTKEAIIAEYDMKIEYHNECIRKLQSVYIPKCQYHQDLITKLEQKKQATLNPKPRQYHRKKGMKYVFEQAKSMGLSPEDVAAKIGIVLN